MALILAGLMLMLYGYSRIYHKDFWWWDTILLWQRLNRPLERSASWERQQDLFGLFCMSAGVLLLVMFAAGGPV